MSLSLSPEDYYNDELAAWKFIFFFFFSLLYYELSLTILQNQATPLIMAAYGGHADVVQLLLSVGANKEAADKVILMVDVCMAV